MKPPENRLATRRVFEGRLLKVDADTVRLPNGAKVELEMVRHPGASAVVPLLSDLNGPDPQLLLIRQFRYAANGMVWEIPAGVLEPGESPEQCARRELLEEVGATAERFDHLTSIYTTPGFTDETIHLFLASGLKVADPAHQIDEFITIETRTISAALEMIRTGELMDAKTAIALLYVAGFRLNM